MSSMGILVIGITVIFFGYQLIKKSKQLHQRRHLEFEGYCLLTQIKEQDAQTGQRMGVFQQGDQEWEWIIPPSIAILEPPIRGYVMVHDQKVTSFES